MTMNSSNPHEVDVVIVGAGPAGLSTALHFLRLDPKGANRLLVLEKETHPRHKLCGGGITCFGLNQLHSLGLSIGVRHIPIRNVCFHYRSQSVRIQGDPVFVVTQRSKFDAWLAECARHRGVKLIEKSPVLKLERCDEGILVTTPDKVYLARVIVGAEGSKGIVRGWIGARERPPRVARVLETIASAHGFESMFQKQEAKFNFGFLQSRLQGYFWIFPSLDHGQPSLNMGVYDARILNTESKAALKQIMGQGLRGINLDVNKFRIEGHPIHWFSPWNRISENRVILVGDAAGSDPLFGEGISISLAYGAVAARNLARAFRENDFGFKGYKRSLLLSSTGRYLLLRWFLASLMARFQGSDLFLRGVWQVGRLLAHFYHPHSPLPEMYPYQHIPVNQVPESVVDS